MFTASGVWANEDIEGYKDFKGYYSFEIMRYKIKENGDEELVERFSSGMISLTSTFIKEFTATSLDEIGTHVRFVVFDTTGYFAGMHPLGLLAWPNNANTPRLLRYSVNTSHNPMTKRMSFEVVNFKSCVFEFDTAFMRTNLLY